ASHTSPLSQSAAEVQGSEQAPSSHTWPLSQSSLLSQPSTQSWVSASQTVPSWQKLASRVHWTWQKPESGLQTSLVRHKPGSVTQLFWHAPVSALHTSSASQWPGSSTQLGMQRSATQTVPSAQSPLRVQGWQRPSMQA